MVMSRLTFGSSSRVLTNEQTDRIEVLKSPGYMIDKYNYIHVHNLTLTFLERSSCL